MNEKEKELMKHFKVEELEERLEMKLWDGHSDGQCGNDGTTCENPVEHPS